MSERHTTSSEAEQQLVFDLMRERLMHMFGPGGSFRITLGRATADDAVFVSAVADTVAHQVAAAFNPERESAGRRVAAPTTIAEHDELWQQIEEDLLVRRTGPRLRRRGCRARSHRGTRGRLARRAPQQQGRLTASA